MALDALPIADDLLPDEAPFRFADPRPALDRIGDVPCDS